MANTLHPYNTLDQHLANILASLAHRLEAARAANNVQLIKLLEREKQEVTAPTAPKTAPKTAAIWQAIVQSCFNHSAQSIHQFENGSDRWWFTVDPRTGREIYADSEAELRLWIQEHSQ